MMPLVPLKFQDQVIEGVLERLRLQAAQYRRLAAADRERHAELRRASAGVVLQAPTGAGKTAIAIDVMSRFSAEERVLWFWFAPFAGLVEQAATALRRQAPQLPQLTLASDRSLSALTPGAVFVTTWSAVAAANAQARLARVTGDAGLALDVLLEQAREQGYRIGCVIDEAHHGFHRARQAQAFFTDVLAPDHALMMTATPRDADVDKFSRDTGYVLGNEADWASVSRADAVDAGLLKRGVRMVRFLARDDDTAQLVDFEQLALRECAAAHRQIGGLLAEQGVGLVPLMLVQVPDGKQAIEAARAYLVDTLGFAESAVRTHTADEPDADLIALAQDPTVEVLLFKMAVAMGFDAPRAWTLAALRGARDPAFGVQVIGRIMRVHALLQRRAGLPPELDYGYVFLANAESQEGLTAASDQINAMRTQAPALGAVAMVTCSGGVQRVQVVSPGETFEIGLDTDSVATAATANAQPTSSAAGAPGAAGGSAWQGAAQLALAMGMPASTPPTNAGAGAPVSGALARFTLATTRQPLRHARRDGVPAQLLSERLPPAPADVEMRLVDHVDFNAQVLACRDKVRVQVRRDETDLFADSAVRADGRDVWAALSPEAVAERAEAVLLKLVEMNQRELRLRLTARFRDAIERSGAIPPDDDEALDQQLDLVIVRNPDLMRKAYRALRMLEVADITITLPAVHESDLPLEPAQRNAYGVFPGDLNADELEIARMLDRDQRVRWWHRNCAVARAPDALGLYRWDDGDGYFPDFVVAMDGRETPDGVALLEVKGEFLWGKASEVDKGAAVSKPYGRVFMVGRQRGTRDFSFLRPLGDRLEVEAAFDVGRLRWP